MTEYAGSGERSLELLWRKQAQPTRGPKPKLDLDRIVEAAIAVADEEGLAPLSMRKVAERLKVGTMSLYTYVPGKSELLDLMVDATAGPSTGGDERARGEEGTRGEEGPRGHERPDGARDWRARLEAIAKAGWDRYHRHPWLLEITMVRPVLGPNVTAQYERELEAIEGIGLTDLEMDAVLVTIAGHVEGAARRALEAQLAEKRTGQNDQEWWQARAPILERLMEPGAYPIASRVGQVAGEAHNAAYAPEHTFWFGLQRILDGIEVLVRSRPFDE